MNGAILTAEGLTLSIDGVELLHNVHFSVPAGKITCLVGESGSGKSLTMAALLGLLPEGAENIGIVTNDFHIFRALATARHVSALNFSGIPAPSTGYGFTHYAMREFFAVGAGLIKGELSF